MAGDFNNVLNFNERIGSEVSVAEVTSFRDCVQYCGLQDVMARGAFFTWNNKQYGSDRVYSRIDRVMINDGMLQMFPEVSAHFMPEGLYDHCPCIISVWQEDKRRKSSFKYFNMWSLSAEFPEVVKCHWLRNVSGTPMYILTQKLKSLKKPLKRLNKGVYGDIEANANIAYINLCDIQCQIQANINDLRLRDKERIAAEMYKELHQARLSFLAQKAKIDWIGEGDVNTAYFHSSIKSRRVRNKVMQVEDKDGVVQVQPEGIINAFIEFYTDLLGTDTKVNRVHVPTVRNGPVVQEHHMGVLLRPVTKEEVYSVLQSIPNNKAPGPDGFSSQFFKDAWHIVGDEFTRAILDFFHSGKMLQQINATVLTLIPKKEIPATVADFRPIACCNVVYKCISKVICNRLGAVLPDIISSCQGAFIQGREIVDNIFICQDLVRLYRRQSCSPRCMMKIDLKKAYDTIEWEFIEGMLHALGFPERLIQWIMVCVRSTSYSIALNGEIHGFLRGKEG